MIYKAKNFQLMNAGSVILRHVFHSFFVISCLTLDDGSPWLKQVKGTGVSMRHTISLISYELYN